MFAREKNVTIDSNDKTWMDSLLLSHSFKKILYLETGWELSIMR